MVIEPRRIAAGFVRRWTSQAGELMSRAFHLWFGLSVVFCAISVVLGELEPLALLPLGLFFYFTSVEIAAAADEREVGLADLPGFLHTAAVGVAQDIWAKRWTLLIVTILVAVNHYDQMTHPVAAPVRQMPPPDLSNVLTWVIGPASPLVHAVTVLIIGTLLQGETFALSSLAYPLRRAFNVDNGQMRTLLYRACFKNPSVAMFLQTVPLALLLGAAMLLPILAPFLMCFLPALSYVAFREIFIDDNGNREPAKQRATSAIAQGGAA
jgi:hypothetical protein